MMITDFYGNTELLLNALNEREALNFPADLKEREIVSFWSFSLIRREDDLWAILPAANVSKALAYQLVDYIGFWDMPRVLIPMSKLVLTQSADDEVTNAFNGKPVWSYYNWSNGHRYSRPSYMVGERPAAFAEQVVEYKKLPDYLALRISVVLQSEKFNYLSNVHNTIDHQFDSGNCGYGVRQVIRLPDGSERTLMSYG